MHEASQTTVDRFVEALWLEDGLMVTFHLRAPQTLRLPRTNASSAPQYSSTRGPALRHWLVLWSP